jgi:hypothetical protein
MGTRFRNFISYSLCIILVALISASCGGSEHANDFVDESSQMLLADVHTYPISGTCRQLESASEVFGPVAPKPLRRSPTATRGRTEQRMARQTRRPKK